MKLAIVISNIDRWITFEWMADRLVKEYEVHFVLLNPGNSYFEAYLANRNHAFMRIPYIGKKDLVGATYQLTKCFRTLQPDVVHTHFLDANIAGLLAARMAGIKKRVHTRHHSVYHHRYHPKGKWYDQLANILSTDIVAISKVVREVLIQKEGVSEEKVHLLHHGFDLSVFEQQKTETIQQFLAAHQLTEDSEIVGVVSRYIEWKGIAYIIEAFERFLAVHPKAVLLLLNARGPDSDQIHSALEKLPKGSFREVAFEPNILEVFPLFHIFIHTPIDAEVEAFGQVYIEALAAGVPSIFTVSGIANEIVIHEYNALVVPFKDANAIWQAMGRLWDDDSLRANLRKNGLNSVKPFGIDDFCNKLKVIYEA